MQEEKYTYVEDAESSTKSYFELFKRKRVKPGKLLNKKELSRRLAYEAQIPVKLGTRLHNAVMRVIIDAVVHQEGINFDDYFSISTKEFLTSTANHPTKGKIPRPSKYKLVVKTNKIKQVYTNKTQKDNNAKTENIT